jgi:hypothetical protein
LKTVEKPLSKTGEELKSMGLMISSLMIDNAKKDEVINSLKEKVDTLTGGGN